MAITIIIIIIILLLLRLMETEKKECWGDRKRWRVGGREIEKMERQRVGKSARERVKTESECVCVRKRG